MAFNFVKYKVNVCLSIVFEKLYRVGFFSGGKSRTSPALLVLSVIKFV